jgi:hypothetical protein
MRLGITIYESERNLPCPLHSSVSLVDPFSTPATTIANAKSVNQHECFIRNHKLEAHWVQIRSTDRALLSFLQFTRIERQQQVLPPASTIGSKTLTNCSKPCYKHRKQESKAINEREDQTYPYTISHKESTTRGYGREKGEHACKST